MFDASGKAAELARFHPDGPAVDFDHDGAIEDDEHLVARRVEVRTIIRPSRRRLVEPDL